MQEMMENMEGMVDEDGNPIYGDEMMGSDEEEDDMEGHEIMHDEGDSYGMEGSPEMDDDEVTTS